VLRCKTIVPLILGADHYANFKCCLEARQKISHWLHCNANLVTKHFHGTFAIGINGVNTVSMTTGLVDVSTVTRNYRWEKDGNMHHDWNFCSIQVWCSGVLIPPLVQRNSTKKLKSLTLSTEYVAVLYRLVKLNSHKDLGILWSLFPTAWHRKGNESPKHDKNVSKHILYRVENNTLLFTFYRT